MSRQPSFALRQMAVHVAALRSSQGASERTWSRLSRRSLAIRNRLSAHKKRQLLNVQSNWQLLYSARAVDADAAQHPKKKCRPDWMAPELRGRDGPPSLAEPRETDQAVESSSSTGSDSSSSSSESECPQVSDDEE